MTGYEVHKAGERGLHPYEAARKWGEKHLNRSKKHNEQRANKENVRELTAVKAS